MNTSQKPMADIDPRVENLDEFDEAEEITATFCQRMTEQQYEDQTSEETEKSLNELCKYLQENPETYFRIIRKRKQDEMENAGLFSYLKVKMMSILHGEQYPSCLVSPEQSAKQLNQLKTDMQKAFIYSEESKGRRYSKRVATRSAVADISDKENTPVLPSQLPPRRTRLESKAKDADTPGKGTEKDARVLRSTTKKSKSCLGLDKLGAPPVMAVLPSKTNTASQESTIVPPPPPPPPPPSLLPQHRVVSVNKHSQDPQAKRRRITHGEVDTNRSVLARAPLTSIGRESSSGGSSTTSAEQSEGREEYGTVASGDAGNVTPSGSLPSSPSDNEFVTPEADVPALKKHKRTLSNVSTGSRGSQSSLNSIHFELMSSNPLTRLRSTQMARSPGGTPMRTLNGPRMPTEPLHKALVTVLRQKFKNARTPSPLTASSATPLTSPDPAVGKNNSLNATFSP